VQLFMHSCIASGTLHHDYDEIEQYAHFEKSVMLRIIVISYE